MIKPSTNFVIAFLAPMAGYLAYAAFASSGFSIAVGLSWFGVWFARAMAQIIDGESKHDR